jgi:hypothetical protein
VHGAPHTLRAAESTQVDFVTFQPRFQFNRRDGTGRVAPVADAPVHQTPHTARPPSPRRRTLRLSSGEFIRSPRADGTLPAQIRNAHHSLLRADGTLLDRNRTS